jgi:hypothetical protein
MPDDTATGRTRGLDRVVELSKPITGLFEKLSSGRGGPHASGISLK